MNWKNVVSDLIASGLTQAQIAEQAGCKQSSISDLHRGKTENPAYSIGNALMAMHKKVQQKAKRKAA